MESFLKCEVWNLLCECIRLHTLRCCDITTFTDSRGVEQSNVDLGNKFSLKFPSRQNWDENLVKENVVVL